MVGCSSDASSTVDAMPTSGDVDNGSAAGGGAYGYTGVGGSSASYDANGNPIVTTPEVESDIEFELPHAGERYVYAVNPESDTVAVIDAATLAIHTVPAGERPRYLQTLAGKDSAIVLNVDSNDATVIRTEDGTSEYWNAKVRSGANAIAVAPDGAHAVVYFDDRYSSEGMTSGNFQDVTVLTIRDDEVYATDMTVGYRPSAVYFDSGSAHGYVVNENGVSLLDFAQIDDAGSGQATTVSMGDGVDDPGSDVSVTSDGLYAVAKHGGNRELRLVDLQAQTSRVLDVVGLVDAALVASATGSGGAPSANPSDGVQAVNLLSDVDISPDSQYVVAVVRYAGAVVRIPLPSGFEDPSLAEITWIPEGRIGQVSIADSGSRAVLFTTADDSDERLTVLDFDGASEPRAVDLHKAVAQVALDPEGKTAFVVHRVTAGNASDSLQEQQVDQSHGYSLVNLDTAFAKLEVTESEVQSFALVPEANSVFISFQTPATVHRLGLSDFVQSSIDLASTPLAVGSVPQSEKVFVSQEHPDGRITFIDWSSLKINTVTGFELNSSISEAR